jgi:hypothetical protein
LSSADDIDISLDMQRYVRTPTKHAFAWSAGGGAYTAWNFGGLQKPLDLHANSELTTASFNTAGLSVRTMTPGNSDDLTRGGPVMRTGWSGGASFNASTPRGKSKQLSAGLNVDISPTLQQGISGSASLTARITPALRLDVTPSMSIAETHRQYVGTVTSAGGGTDTYGARYLFGHLDRKEAALELRATWSLSPDLVLTLYAQPFVSVGRYDQIGELVAAGSADVRWYETAVHDRETRSIVDGPNAFSISEPDFRVASLRSTAVLKWELAPGSTLFVVWQQTRGGVPLLPTQPLNATVPDMFSQSALHTIAIKLSYWFG